MDVIERYEKAKTALLEHTPGIRRALKALAHAKVRNANKAAKGQPVTIGGTKISAASYKSHYGLPGRLQRT